jgi:hypothetical protein
MDALERYIAKRQKPIYFRLKISPDDRQRLAMLSTSLGLSQSSTIRRLIRQAAEAEGVRLEAGSPPARAEGVGN